MTTLPAHEAAIQTLEAIVRSQHEQLKLLADIVDNLEPRVTRLEKAPRHNTLYR